MSTHTYKVDRRSIVKSNMLRAKKKQELKDGLGGDSQFSDILTNCWIAYEAYATDKYAKEGVRDRIDSFCKDHQKDYELFIDNPPDDFKINMIQLENCQILDMRPNHEKGNPKEITDSKQLIQVMYVIYQVRNNLFHGGKNDGNNDDRIIINCASIVFYRLLENILIKEGYLKW